MKQLLTITAILFGISASIAEAQDPKPTEKAIKFAQDVTTHVVLHELGHALIREFDLPVLANEETQADAFATFYLTNHLPERSVDVIEARVRSLMIEANEVARDEWTVRGEHNSDARRAYQIVAIALAGDAEKFQAIAKEIGMSESNIRSCRDYGSEIHRSWRRILKGLWMEPGERSKEIRIGLDKGSQFISDFCGNGLAQEIEDVLAKFDWHSQVTVFFAEGDGGAGWNRGRRTVTVNSEYIERFIRQGSIATR